MNRYVVFVFFAVLITLGILELIVASKPKYVRVIKIMLVVCTGVVGAYGLMGKLPKPAKPIVSHLEFYGMGPWFYCDFQARNAGDRECAIDGVEFQFPESRIRLAKSVNFLKGRRGETVGVIPTVTCSSFPEQLSEMEQQFAIMGSKDTREDWPDPMTVIISFTSEGRKLNVTRVANTLKNCEISNMEF